MMVSAIWPRWWLSPYIVTS